MKIWIDDEIVEKDDPRARVSVFDHGLLYGDGVFEGIRIRGGRIFRLDDHLRRLLASCDAIGLALPGGAARARRAAVESARALDQDEAYLRLVVTRGEGPLGIDPTTCSTPRLFCIAGTIQLFDAAKTAAGVDLITTFWRRPPADVLDPRVKSLNYLNNVLSKREAKLRGADEALVLNREGRIAEASGANLFVWRRGRLLTPPATEGALEGITRRTILELAPNLGLEAAEVPLNRADVLDADAVFLTGSGAGITRVRSLDGVEVGKARKDPEHDVAGRLLAALVAYTGHTGTSFRD